MNVAETTRELSPERQLAIANRAAILGIERPSLSPERRKVLAENTELVKGLDTFVGKLVDARESEHPWDSKWMPHDFLPDLGTEEGIMVDLPRLQERMTEYSDEEIVALVGVTETEEGLPLFLGKLSGDEAIGDKSQTGWRRWNLRWTAEEKRHGGVLVPFLDYSDRVDMVAFERTNSAYLNNGFEMNTEDPVEFVVFTRIQEDGTQIAHRRDSRIAKKRGADDLSRASASVAGEEGGHKTFYGAVLVEAAKQNPDAAVIATRNMVERGVDMPGARMTEGELLPLGQRESKLFKTFKLVAERTGVYTMRDYLGVIRGVKDDLDMDTRTDLTTPEGREAQDALGKIDEEYQNRKGDQAERLAKKKSVPTLPWMKPYASSQRATTIFETNPLS